MPHLPRHIVGPPIQAAVQDQSCAQSRTEGQEYHIFLSPGPSKPAFRHGSGVGVILQAYRNPEPFPQDFHDGHIPPAHQVGRVHDDPLPVFQRPAAADTDSGQVGHTQPVPGKQILRQFRHFIHSLFPSRAFPGRKAFLIQDQSFPLFPRYRLPAEDHGALCTPDVDSDCIFFFPYLHNIPTFPRAGSFR